MPACICSYSRSTSCPPYIDIDAHHGDGVFYAFQAEPRLIYADLHEDGHYLYPGSGDSSETGKGPAQDCKLNVPMPPYANDEAFYPQFDAALTFVAQHKPEFIIFQCGADSMAGDPLTDLEYSYHAHAYAAKKIVALAHTLGHDRVLGLGGGGYNLQNIAEAWCAVVEALAASE